MPLVCLTREDVTILELLVSEEFVAEYMNICLKLLLKSYDDSVF